jgi:transposase InsO family protein
VSTWAGVVYVCFIVDAHSRIIVGWPVASHMRTTVVIDAVEMVRWSRGNLLPGSTCHSDAGSQFTSIRYGERLAEIGRHHRLANLGGGQAEEFVEARRLRRDAHSAVALAQLPRRPGKIRWDDLLGGHTSRTARPPPPVDERRCAALKALLYTCTTVRFSDPPRR